MRTTRQLSKALQNIQFEAAERIKTFFRKNVDVILIEKEQHLRIGTGIQSGTVKSISKNGDIIFDTMYHSVIANSLELPANALLTILDELERMKKSGTLPR